MDSRPTGLQAAAATYGDRVASVGVDTWGVDFGLLGRGDELLGNPYHYRDRRTAGMFDKAFSIVPREGIFAQTGLQFMELNTLYQLLAMTLQKSPLLDAAESLLMMPDLFHWLLTGEKANEFTDVSTTQMYNPLTKTWSCRCCSNWEFPRIFSAPSCRRARVWARCEPTWRKPPACKACRSCCRARTIRPAP
jgi:rhamnulokinase